MSISPAVHFELPEDVHEILDNALVYADELNARHADTVKYFVDGHPDLFVRLMPQRRVIDRPGVDSLVEHGVNVLPYHTVEHNGEQWVVTKRVRGKNLDVALGQNTDEHSPLIQQVDSTWAGLAANLITARDLRLSAAYDVDDICQYMFGSIRLDGTSRQAIYLVDIPQAAWPTWDESYYADMVLGLANAVVEVESFAGAKMHLARTAIQPAIERIYTGCEWPRQLALASQYVLDHGVMLHSADNEELIRDIAG